MPTTSDAQKQVNNTILLPKSLFVATLDEVEVENLQTLNDLRLRFSPNSLEQRVLDKPETTNRHAWPVHMYVFLKDKTIPPQLPRNFKLLVKKHAGRFKLRENVLLRKTTVNDQEIFIPYLPFEFRL